MFLYTILIQCRVLEEKLLQKEAEFESFKEQVKTKPETRLQTELSLLRIEKVICYMHVQVYI